jgi:hypothetical protein
MHKIELFLERPKTVTDKELTEFLERHSKWIGRRELQHEEMSFVSFPIEAIAELKRFETPLTILIRSEKSESGEVLEKLMVSTKLSLFEIMRIVETSEPIQIVPQRKIQATRARA